jgi:RNA polymerase sigma-70 factor (ECF subfamily)
MATNRTTVDDTVALDELERLYRNGFHEYLRVAEAIAGDRERGLESVQEGFARALQSRSGFRGEALVSTWVWRCVINAAKAARPRFGALLTNEMVDPETLDRGSHNSYQPSSLERLIVSLPQRQKLVLFLRYYADMDYRTIADVLSVRKGTIGATLNKAHAALRKQLEEVPQ